MMDLEDRNKKLCVLYESGKTIPEISKESGLSMTQLSRIFRKYGVKRKKFELDKEYFDNNSDKTMREISEKTGLSQKRVRHLKKIAYGQKITRGKTDFTGMQPTVDVSNIDDPDWLYDQYVIQQKGAPTIAKMLAVKCSDIYRAFKKHGIPRRTIKNMMEHRRKWPSEKWLRDKYEINKWSVQRCAEEFDSSWESIYAALRHYGIPTRSASEQHVGDMNWFFGRTHPEHIRKLCSHIGSRCGHEYWNTGDVEAKIEAVRLRSKEIWSDPVRRSESSKRISELCKQGKCNSKHHICECKDGTILLVKSSWEKLMVKILDNSELVVDWKYESVSIEYMDGDIVRNFIVDFWVKWIDDFESLIECKNQRLLQNDKERLKIEAMGEYCKKHNIGMILIDNKAEIKKMTNGYRDMVKWQNNTRYKVGREYLEEPKLFVDMMFHDIIMKICPWKPLKYSKDELMNDVSRLRNEKLDSYIRNGRIHSTAPNSGGMPGRVLMTHFNSHFWDVSPKNQKPLTQAFDDKDIIYRCLKISYSENESLSTERLLREINFHYGKYGRSSHFAPGFARIIIKEMDGSGCKIFDPCCGWGGRLLGSWLEGCQYGGCDISPNTYAGLKSIAEFIKFDCNIFNYSCLDLDWPDCDLIFTSPPFYDIEEYIGGRQPWMAYGSREEWVTKFISVFVSKIQTKCVLYLDHKTKDDFEQIRKFDKIIEVKNRRHARRKELSTELLCVYI